MTWKGLTRFGVEGRSRSSFQPIASMYFAVDYGHYIHAIDICTCVRLPHLRLFETL